MLFELSVFCLYPVPFDGLEIKCKTRVGHLHGRKRGDLVAVQSIDDDNNILVRDARKRGVIGGDLEAWNIATSMTAEAGRRSFGFIGLLLKTHLQILLERWFETFGEDGHKPFAGMAAFAVFSCVHAKAGSGETRTSVQ